MAAFAAYCQSFARWKEAQEHIDEEGSTFSTDKGYQQQSLDHDDNYLDFVTYAKSNFWGSPHIP